LKQLAGVVDLGARCRRKFAELASQLVGMVRSAAVEIDQIAVDVVHDFEPGGRLCQEKGAATGECFDVASAVRNVRKEALEVPGLSAGPG
jgi:hypothetical protein